MKVASTRPIRGSHRYGSIECAEGKPKRHLEIRHRWQRLLPELAEFPPMRKHLTAFEIVIDVVDDTLSFRCLHCTPKPCVCVGKAARINDFSVALYSDPEIQPLFTAYGLRVWCEEADR